ncbi:hypothetical protein [Streptacidiphilus sp. EB129]|uniref:hypothetical protein n=1 Tax=Streptacidiphilus sp. EB129 TaxID=3156262 RepID=UPI0035121CB6
MSSRPAPRLGVLPESLLFLGGAALVIETVLALVGGLTAAAGGAAALAAVVPLAVRYVQGADAMDSDYRRKVRLVGSREPTLRYWDAAIEDSHESLSGYELHLRPLLQRLFAVRLAERHGVSLHTQPERAAALIGPELWPWIDPSRVRISRHPLDARPAGGATVRRVDPRLAPEPLPPHLLTALVDRLEHL